MHCLFNCFTFAALIPAGSRPKGYQLFSSALKASEHLVWRILSFILYPTVSNEGFGFSTLAGFAAFLAFAVFVVAMFVGFCIYKVKGPELYIQQLKVMYIHKISPFCIYVSAGRS